MSIIITTTTSTIYMATVLNYILYYIKLIEHWPNKSLNEIQFGNEKAKHRHVI